MHHFIFPTQDTWVSSGSSIVTGESDDMESLQQELAEEFASMLPN